MPSFDAESSTQSEPDKKATTDHPDIPAQPEELT
jgi:hypothetical protein